MELTEDFLAMLIIAITIVGILGIFFIFIQYNIIICYDSEHREAIAFGDILLASSCLAEEEIINGKTYLKKGLFLEEKLNEDVEECINYNKGKIIITYLDGGTSWEYSFPNTNVKKTSCSGEEGGGTTTYFVAIKDSDGIVKMASMEVEI